MSASAGIRVGVGVVLVLWYVAACAMVTLAQDGEPDLLQFPWAQAAVAVLVTVGAGLPATWGRELTALYAQRPFDLRREMRKDVAVSVSLGVAGYAAGLMWAASAEAVALGLVVIGYGGTRVLTTAVDWALDFAARRRQQQQQP